MAPVKSCGTRLNSNVNLLNFSKMSRELVCVWVCELLRHGHVGSDLFAQMRETRWNLFSSDLQSLKMHVYNPIHMGTWRYQVSLTWCVFIISQSNNNLLFSRDVALSYGCAIHLSHLHVTLDLAEIQSEVLATDSHERAALPGSP